jgi:hypothetical protein
MPDYSVMKSRVEQFDAEHGASVFQDNWIVFEDGAMREGNSYGVLSDPPEDPLQLAKRKLRYREIILQRATEEFRSRKDYFVRAAKTNMRNRYLCSAPPADGEQAAAELKGLQHVVRIAKGKYDAALAAVEASKPQRLKEVEALNAANQAANAALLQAINGIEV